MEGMKMIFRLRRIIIAVFILNSLIWPLNVYGGKEDVKYKEYEVISTKDGLELQCDMKKGRFIVKNLKDGILWKSFVEKNEMQSGQNFNEKWLDIMSSIVVLYYTNYSGDASIASADKSVKTVCKEEKDKLVIAMDFTGQQIRLKINIWLQNDALNVEIPGKEIEEYGQNGIMKLDILPFLMSAQKYDSGYMFYPDGCGALYYFKDVNLPYAYKQYTFDVYSKPFDRLGPERYEETNEEITTDLIEKMRTSTTNHASIPVFGIKKGKSAVLGIINEGECNASINVDPAGYAVDINRLFPTMAYRSMYKDPRPEVAKMVSYYEKKYTVYDTHVEYIFLSGDNADYSGMANAYRTKLMKEDGIKPGAGQFSGALSLFCGIVQKQILFNRFITSVTFSQAKTMLNEIGVNNLMVNMKGSGENGYGVFNRYYAPAGRLGGKKDFAKLMDYSKLSGDKIYIEDNFIDILPGTKKSMGFNGLCIRDSNNVLISDDKNQQFMVSPKASYDIFKSEYMKTAISYKPDGITFGRMGEQIYRDCNEKRSTSLQECINLWRNFLDCAKSNLGGCAVQGGNIYTAGKVKWLYDVPMKDSGCAINDDVIPFYQMVMHGLADYSGQPGNLTHDFGYTRLQWVEGGCLPYFELTYSKSEEIMKTTYNQLYSSSYNIWKGTVKTILNEYNKYLKDLQKAFIIRHEKLNEKIVKVTYSNGTRIYINYGETDWKQDGKVIPAMDYVIMQPGRKSS